MENLTTRGGAPHDVTVVIDDVHVVYRVYEDRKAGIRDIVNRGFRARPFREIHALRGVRLIAHAGDVIGVIGANGSGKSSLLKAVAGLLPVTQGSVYASSRPTLLGVGAALNSRLSGRRNMYIGGLALGLAQRDIDERFDSMVEFSGLADFIDLPLRTYSSGMKARLAFTIATAVEPEILLIDEALAVGDREFKKRSMERINELRERAGTIFLVTHSLDEVTNSCDRAIWLHHGEIMMEGSPADVVNAYQGGDEP